MSGSAVLRISLFGLSLPRAIWWLSANQVPGGCHVHDSMSMSTSPSCRKMDGLRSAGRRCSNVTDVQERYHGCRGSKMEPTYSGIARQRKWMRRISRIRSKFENRDEVVIIPVSLVLLRFEYTCYRRAREAGYSATPARLEGYEMRWAGCMVINPSAPRTSCPPPNIPPLGGICSPPAVLGPACVCLSRVSLLSMVQLALPQAVVRDERTRTARGRTATAKEYPLPTDNWPFRWPSIHRCPPRDASLVLALGGRQHRYPALRDWRHLPNQDDGASS